MSKEAAKKTVFTSTGLIAAGLALTACVKAPPAYSDDAPSWTKDASVCAVELGADHSSLGQVEDAISKVDPNYSGRGILVSGQAGHVGQIVNLNVVNPNTAQQPGDVVLADASQQACADPSVGGKYGPTTPYEAVR